MVAMMKTSNRWLGLLGAVAVMFSAGVSSQDCNPDYYADGDCDERNNSEACGNYDGGDCCACTCVDTRDYTCGENGFQCVDPAAACVDDDDVTIEQLENCGWIRGIGNGFCDTENNNAVCDYDGGDCCSCTCLNATDDDYGCRDGFQCIDPAASCVDDDDITVDQVENCGYVGGIGNGRCDSENNNELCEYDGGDCCSCTCVTATDDDYGCREDFQCIDPAAPCVDDDDITVDQVENCGWVAGVGNGYCDQENNNELCKYDGGDCCECTCVAQPRTDDYSGDDYNEGCGSRFQCIDPAAPCVDDDDITVDHVDTCDSGNMSNAYCNEENNRPECNYDGGDCCSCTCIDTPNQECGQYNAFACVDPDAQCVEDDDITADMLDACGWVGGIGNGYCDEGNNKPECNYDGGDCCQCTCDPSNASDDGGCGGQWAGFACIDPMAPCVDDDSVTVDMINICDAEQIGNGYCDDDNNTPECAYDGGDCCSCTCEPSPGGDDDDACERFACVDPSAPCVNDDDITVDMFENCRWVVGVGNGYCDDEMNIPECNYDGGDCCECTCEVEPFADDESNGRYAGCNEFACIDPEALCVDDDFVTVDMVENCGYVLGIGNGYCDSENNTELCAYDGGDCCECTCEVGPFADDEYDGRYSGCKEFQCIDPSADCVNDDDITANMLEDCEWIASVGNGYCDIDMNTPECNYDGGDCCECTCEVGPFADDDGPYSGCNDFACIDPEAPCVDDDLITIEMIENCDCVLAIGNGYCNRGNNNELCLYDGGDCCSCTCSSDYDDDYACSADGNGGFDCKDPAAPCISEEETTDDDFSFTDVDFAMSYAMSYEFVPWEQEGPLPTYEGAIEVGAKTEVGVTATAYDVRTGMSSVDSGCGGEGGDGCVPANTRDGVASAVESRWSCATKLVEDGGPCQIEYTFAERQDIVDIQVAFWEGNERIRTLDVHLNGEKTHTHESYNSGTAFNTLDVVADGVTTVMLESVGLTSDEWISLIEVLIFVKPEEGLQI